MSNINPLTSFLYWLSNTDVAVVQRSGNEAQTNRTIIGSILFFCALLAFVSCFYLIYLASNGSIIGATIGGFIYGGIVLILSQLVFKSKSTKVLIFRSLVICLFSVFTAMPIKLLCLHTTLAQNIEQETYAYNQKLKQQIVGKVEQSYKTQLHVANRSLTKAMEDKAPIEVITELRDSKKELEAQKLVDIAAATNTYNVQKKRAVMDFLSLYIAYFKLLTDRNSATNMAVFTFSWVALVVIMIVELSPIIVRLVLSKSDYDKQIENKSFLMEQLIDLRTRITYAEIMKASDNVDKDNQDKYASMTPKQLATMKATFNRLLNELQNNYHTSNLSFQAYEHSDNGVMLEDEYRN